MSKLDPVSISTGTLAELNRELAPRTAQQRIEWALQHLPGGHALSTSFGVQSAVSLHLLTQVIPDIPVILVDTGYLFPETYRYADQLVEQLGLNLHVHHPEIGSAWMEARFGKLWEAGSDGLHRYNQLRKVEPMQRALRQLDVRSWHAGLRREQSRSRRDLPFLDIRDGRFKFHPIADWTDQEIGGYMLVNALPEHPLARQGYVSIGDVHTTQPLLPGMDAAQTRFFGLRRECGLHFDEPTVSAA
ncbi:MAG: phosphoadenylyl-sulfate reductase [Thermomonas sp.]|uniref:phosphoadenylyl-sulfate reductase n=1 Tax=Thermomonas sp. TaxID=1971895 RepID=UPI0026164898|nr:phosphoadenylyl-sulfate reductase [Thermomonas sp.]MCC7097008.1 phosphoadenylyl-sulfate reductase [Thermomonas sp.]